MKSPPVQVQVAMTTIGMLRHGCHESSLGDVEEAAEQAVFRAACDRLRRYLAADIQEPAHHPPAHQHPFGMLIVEEAHMARDPRRAKPPTKRRKKS